MCSSGSIRLTEVCNNLIRSSQVSQVCGLISHLIADGATILVNAELCFVSSTGVGVDIVTGCSDHPPVDAL